MENYSLKNMFNNKNMYTFSPGPWQAGIRERDREQKEQRIEREREREIERER